MRHPGLEQLGHEEGEAVEDPRRPRRLVGLSLAAALHDPLDERRRARLEHAVELADARPAGRPPALQRLGELHHRDRLLHEAEPGQAGGHPFEEPLAGKIDHNGFFNEDHDLLAISHESSDAGPDIHSKRCGESSHNN